LYICDISRIVFVLQSNENLSLEDVYPHGSFSLVLMGCMKECVKIVREIILNEVVKIRSIIAKIIYFCDCDS